MVVLAEQAVLKGSDLVALAGLAVKFMTMTPIFIWQAQQVQQEVLLAQDQMVVPVQPDQTTSAH